MRLMWLAEHPHDLKLTMPVDVVFAQRLAQTVGELVEGLRELIDESARSAGPGVVRRCCIKCNVMRQIVLTEFPLAETGAVMRPGSDQRSHFTTESANQTAAEAISIMLAFRPYRCLSQQSAPNGGSRLLVQARPSRMPANTIARLVPTSVRPAPSR